MSRYSGTGSGDDAATGLVVDSSGNVTVTGYALNTSTATDYATIKYNTSGNPIWVATTTTKMALDKAAAIALDPVGNVYVTEASDGVGTNFDYATIMYNSNGSQVWVRRTMVRHIQATPRSRSPSIPRAMFTSLAVALTAPGPGAGDDYATLRYSPEGILTRELRYDGPSSDNDFARAMAVDQNGNVYVTGISEGGYGTIKYSQPEEGCPPPVNQPPGVLCGAGSDDHAAQFGESGWDGER